MPINDILETGVLGVVMHAQTALVKGVPVYVGIIFRPNKQYWDAQSLQPNGPDAGRYLYYSSGPLAVGTNVKFDVVQEQWNVQAFNVVAV